MIRRFLWLLEQTLVKHFIDQPMLNSCLLNKVLIKLEETSNDDQ